MNESSICMSVHLFCLFGFIRTRYVGGGAGGAGAGAGCGALIYSRRQTTIHVHITDGVQSTVGIGVQGSVLTMNIAIFCLLMGWDCE